MDPMTWLALVVGLLVGLALGLWWRRGRSEPERCRRPQGREDFPLGARQVLDSLASTVIVLDQDNRVVHSTHHAADQGFVRDGVVPHQEIRDLVEECRADREVLDRDVRVSRSLLVGGTVSLGCRVFPLGSQRVVILLEDRSRAQRVEAVRRDFVANVSHELKTPVGGLALLSEAVLDAREDPEAVERFARRMTVESERLTRLVQDILDFSRLQAGEAAESAEPVDVVDVVSTAVDQVRVHADGRGVAVRQAGVAHGPERRVFGNQQLLVTAVRNLLVNAVNYSEPGTKVVVTVAGGDQPGTVRIVVTDQGVGIPAGDLERIFERFYRVDSARSRQTGGTGLGLAIVKHVVSNHGGTVSVWSRVGTGSTFTLELPSLEATSTEAAEGDAASLT
ncbi:two-component sensor histidine kinase [Kytococcus schroeteri]|uniref:Sensor-like histidine kinase SenX3 n=1 Tax=Kytococcus schroeteri TaxID=138300 RepID=A0A2I1P994_9MICO|nr:ATP-binding protein [Kytococcus schroeteri]PKZ41205.1 two-component sensor histidine kinase [Kytococcus schroeteri]